MATDNTNRIGGTIFLTIDGVQYAARGNWSVSPSSVKRDGIAGQDYVHGYTEKPIVPGAKGDLSTVPGLSVENLQNITNSTVVLQLANGKTYSLAQAWTAAAFEIDTTEGKLGVEFGCITCDEI